MKNHSRISIVGGGPAGTFFACHLLEQARTAGRHFEISIIEKRTSRGCNSCAGVISPGLYLELINHGLEPPETVVCENFSHVWIQGSWKNFPLKVPEGQKLCSVFRGSLPTERGKAIQGFDAFLLEKMKQMGVKVIRGNAVGIHLADGRKPVITLKKDRGTLMEIESDFACLCSGVNATAADPREGSTLIESIKKIDPAFTLPETRQTLIFEIKSGCKYIRRHLNRELYLIVTGSKHLRLEHIALVPKKEHISAALVGETIDRAVFPEDTRKIINNFLRLPQVRSILPGITPENVSVSCSCSPKMVTGVSRPIKAERVAMIGDILGARLYRDGMYSAFKSARVLAETAVLIGVDKHSLYNAESSFIHELEKDNRHCKKIFSLMQNILKSGLPARILYQSFATEMKFRATGRWPLGSLLWKVGSGGAEYKDIKRSLFRLPVMTSLAVGTVKTVRNILTEYFFGLSWGAYGRYPAVILRDKRKAIKNSIQKPLGITLYQLPEMERMYAVKIKASSHTIYKELSKFGENHSKFLRLRFVDVKRTRGRPNQPGSVVTYHLKHSPVSMNIKLVQAIPDRTLFYEPEELFTTRGKLIFDITPTMDGNNRLVVYTAFNYKKGRTISGRIFFTLFKLIFPDFAHDVVWNHAVCTIKAEAEKADAERHL